MGLFGPYETRVEIVERTRRLVDLLIRNNDPNVTSYRLYGERVLNDSYGNPASATFGATAGVPGGSTASGSAQIATVIPTDELSIAGVTFTAQAGAANPALQQFDDTASAGTDPLCAASLVLAINDPASQALILAASGVTVTASSGITDTVTLTADASGPGGVLALATNSALTVIITAMTRTALTPFIPNVGCQEGFRSPLIRRRGLGMLESRAQLRRMSRIVFDPDDYTSTPTMPAEEEILFVRVQEFALTAAGYRTVLGPVNTGEPVLGPIVVVPPANFYGSPNATMSLGGIAPANTGAIGGAVVPFNAGGQDPGAMHIVFPRPATIRLTNLAAGTSLLYSTGLGYPMAEIPAGGVPASIEGGIKDILLAGGDNTGAGAVSPAFSMTVVVNLGSDL